MLTELWKPGDTLRKPEEARGPGSRKQHPERILCKQHELRSEFRFSILLETIDYPKHVVCVSALIG